MPPFWSKMPTFFAYPFQVNGLTFLTLITLLAGIAFIAAHASNLLMILPFFIMISLIISQGLRVIEFCSQGKTQPPDFLDLFNGNSTTLKTLGLMFAYGVALVFISRLGMIGTLGTIALSALMPASIMLLAISGSLAHAIDPTAIFDIARKMGWSYLGLGLILALISAGPEQAIALIPQSKLADMQEQNPEAFTTLLIVMTTYFNMVMGAMMGYLLYQHHGELGIATDDEYNGTETDKRVLELARATILTRESRIEEALRQLGGLISDFPDDTEIHTRYHSLLCESGCYPERIAPHTDRYLEFLIKSQRTELLIPAFEAARKHIPDYKPKVINARIGVANKYFQQRHYKKAVNLLSLLHKEVATSPELPEAYFLLARIYSEGPHDDEKAIMILDYISKHFPNTPLSSQINSYRNMLVTLAQKTKAQS